MDTTKVKTVEQLIGKYNYLIGLSTHWFEKSLLHNIIKHLESMEPEDVIKHYRNLVYNKTQSESTRNIYLQLINDLEG